MKDRPNRLSFTALARFFSIAGHPFLLIPLTVAAATRSLLWTAVVLASTTLPLTAITIRNVRRGTWSDPDVSSHKQRPGLYLVAVPVFLAVMVLLWSLDAPPRMLRSALATGAMLVVGISLNRWLKVSLHMMFAAYCGIVIADSYRWSAVPLAAFVVAIAWSRWKLSRHTVAEIMVGLILGTIAGLVAVHDSPRIARFKDPSTVDPGDSLVVVLDPFRDRAPERAAEALLRELRAGRCEAALAFDPPQYRADTCEREHSYRLVTWKLRDIEKEPNGDLRIFYATYRVPVPVPTNTWVTVRRSGNTWRCVEFECWY